MIKHKGFIAKRHRQEGKEWFTDYATQKDLDTHQGQIGDGTWVPLEQRDTETIDSILLKMFNEWVDTIEVVYLPDDRVEVRELATDTVINTTEDSGAAFRDDRNLLGMYLIAVFSGTLNA